MFSEIWRWVEVSKYKALKSLKGLGRGGVSTPLPPKEKPSMEGKWKIPVMKDYTEHRTMNLIFKQ